MDLNKWEAFLSDSELQSSPKFQNRHTGEYLFGKISHDSLACLNNYLAVLSLLSSQDVKIGNDTLAWFEAQKEAVETAVAKIYSLPKQPKDSDAWPSLIVLLGSKLREVQTFTGVFPNFSDTTPHTGQDLVVMAMANLRGLQAIYKDIQAENYKQLLITTKYYT